MSSLKIISIVTLLAFAAVFIYQNSAAAQLTFLFWSVSMSTSLIVMGAFLTGCIAGLFLSFLNARRKNLKTKAENKR